MMTNFSYWSLNQFQQFLFILMRVAPIIFMMPPFSARNLSPLIKAGVTLVVCLALWPIVKREGSLFPSEPFSLIFYMLSEFMIGFIMGLSIRMVLGGVQLAGELVGFQMGFAMAHLIDPQSGMDTTLIAQFHYLLGLLIFLLIDGHHWFFRALSQSFYLIPPGDFYLQEGLYQYLLDLSGKMFITAIKMAAPVMAIMILIQIALGIVARTIPQVNILINSFPLTIGLGLVFLGLSMELLFPYLKDLFEESGKGLVHTLLPLMKR